MFFSQIISTLTVVILLLLLLLSKYILYNNAKLSILYCTIEIFLFIAISIRNNSIYSNNIYESLYSIYLLFNIAAIYLYFNWRDVLRNFDFWFFLEIKLSQIYCVVFVITIFAIRNFIFVIDFYIYLLK